MQGVAPSEGGERALAQRVRSPAGDGLGDPVEL